MRKFFLAALCLSTLAGFSSVLIGCGPSVRVVETPAGQQKQGFKAAIQNNPNIPENVKKSFR